MRFWLKIGVLSFAGYFGCYASFLVQDRREHHAVVSEVEGITRSAMLTDCTGTNQAEVEAKLTDAKRRLDRSDARWQHDAGRLLLLSSAD